MYCNKCGNKIEKNSTFCGKCGKSINDDKNIRKFKFKNKKILIPCIFVISVIIIYLIIFNIGKNNLKNDLLKNWYRVEVGEAGSLYELKLEFSKDKVDYKFITSYSWLNTTIASFNYKVISFNQIRAKDKTYKIEFNKDKSMFKVTPALTSTDSSETWYNFD